MSMKLAGQDLPEVPLAKAGVTLASSSFVDADSQTNDPQDTATQTDAGKQQAPEKNSQKQLQEEEKQRMLGVIPNFNTVMSGAAPPLTPKQKFNLFFHSSVDPFVFFTAGVDAEYEQSQNQYSAYGRGFPGYAKRYGASYTDSFDGNFWGNAVLPSVLHQDPRYFRLGRGSFKSRLWYATIATVRCRGDNGKWQPNYSNVVGNLIGGGISNIYYPAADRGIGLTFERGFTVSAEGAIGSIAVEFYPDAIAWLKNRHNKGKAATAPAATSQP